jgi:hypothetical protein
MKNDSMKNNISSTLKEKKRLQKVPRDHDIKLDFKSRENKKYFSSLQNIELIQKFKIAAIQESRSLQDCTQEAIEDWLKKHENQPSH